MLSNNARDGGDGGVHGGGDARGDDDAWNPTTYLLEQRRAQSAYYM